MRRTAAAVALGLIASAGFAQNPAPPKAPAKSAVYPRGQKLLDDYFRAQTRQVAGACLADLTTKAAWEARKPELRRQFFEMMGLWPTPPKTNLNATVTGRAEGEGFTVERLHFQSLPGLYVTANLYLPNPQLVREAGKVPAVLYVCGHANTVENGVSFGSKVSYQYHPAWFAAHGYACLILDTLQLAEIEGIHHGTYNRGMWWWHTRGYTPAGVETWNAIRALDYLETRPEIDATRIGVTGRSGGGATSWWIAAADERIKAAVPVAGIADLQSHLYDGTQPHLAARPRFPDGVISGHCDCMYFVNTYRWDFPTVAALIAPRPLLLGNTDADDIFPVQGYRRLADKARKVYALYGAEEKFQLLEEKGPHKDGPELRRGINAWMNRWLKNDTSAKLRDDLPPPLRPHDLKVLGKKPEDERNTAIHEFLIRPAAAELPQSPKVAAEWWANRRPELMKALREKVFGGWPTDAPPLKPVVAADLVHDGVRVRAVDFVSEEAVELRLFVLSSPTAEKPSELILTVLDEPGWEKWCRDLGPAFADAHLLDAKPARDDAAFAQNRAAVSGGRLAFAAIAPRGVGPTKWADPGSREDIQVRRRFPLLGQTLDGQRVWDVQRAVGAVRTLDDLKSAPLTLQGRGEAAGLALYAGLFEPGVAGFDLWNPPPSVRQGPTLLNVARHLDNPQAVALALPRPVALHVGKADRPEWEWAVRLQTATGGDALRVKAGE